MTIPAMLATIQITRAPWEEKPLVTRSVLARSVSRSRSTATILSSVRAFPIAAQLGGFIRVARRRSDWMLGYTGIAPTLPVLGSGGNTTSFGFLARLGMEYITNEVGPDEGLKPAAFLWASSRSARPIRRSPWCSAGK